jgi:acyl-CoA thioesterase YciA
MKAKAKLDQLPLHDPVLRVTTRPNDANPKGDIFGGWLMSQIDIAAAITAAGVAKGPVSTVAVKELQFIHPLFINDLVSLYAHVIKVGNTSVTVGVDVYAQHNADLTAEPHKIADAVMVFVAIEKPGIKRLIPK